MKKGINAYKKTSTDASIAYADPHKLIDMLLTAGIDNLSKAIGYIERNEISEKGRVLGKAFDIVVALKQSLSDEDNEMRNNLFDLYEFSIESIMRGNLKSDPEKLNEVIDILKSIREGWRGIPQELRGTKGSGTINSSISEGHESTTATS
jgi:flagellar protein FliS